MDHLDEYRSLIQSVKAHYLPKMDLKLTSVYQLEPEKQLAETSEPIQVPMPSIEKISVIGSTAPSHNTDLSSLESSPIDHSLHTTIKEACPREIFYKYAPVGISHINKSPSFALPNVPIFYYKENCFDPKFIENVIAAIQNKFSITSSLIDMQEIEDLNLWRSVISMQHVRCIIASDTWERTSSHGKCWYRNHPNTNNCFLGTIPFIVLSSRENWYIDVHNKKVLWNQLCRILKRHCPRQPTAG